MSDAELHSLLKSLAGLDSRAREEARQALRERAQDAVPQLAQALKDDDWQVRQQAAVALGWLGPQAKAAVGALVDALKEEDKYLRGQAAASLGQIGPDARDAVPALTEALKDSEEDVRREAAALGRIGPVARATVSELVAV